MAGAIGALFGSKKPKGPSNAQIAAESDREARAADESAKNDAIAALALQATSRRRALSYSNSALKTTLG